MEHTVLDGRFELRRELGENSWKSSRVFLAQDMNKGKNICIKIAKRSLEREFKVLKELQHRGIPKAHGHGKIPFEGSEMNYLARGFVKGLDSHSYFRDYAFLTQEERAKSVGYYLSKAAEIVSYLHSLGKYHGDLKPYDFVMHERSISLIDLESVIEEGEWNPDRTKTFSAPEINGLLNVMSPDKRADVYSLGAIMFDLFCAYDECAQKLMVEERWKGLDKINEECDLGIPIPMMDVMMKSTEYMPDDRHKDVMGMMDDLRNAQEKL